MAEQDSFMQQLQSLFWKYMGSAIGQTERPHDILYHYTNLDSFMGMIDNRSIWMSKGNFLNDSGELVYIHHIARHVLELFEQHINQKYGNDVELLKCRNRFMGKMRWALSKFLHEIHLDHLEVYVLSLTPNQDSLTLWYNYSGGDGYNIGFSYDKLLAEINHLSENMGQEFSVVYGNVLYEKEKQEQTLLHSLIRSFEFLLQHRGQFDDDEMVAKLPAYFTEIITSCSIFFKHEAFKNEEEYRIAFTRRRKANTGDGKVLFRSANGIIIPYISIELKEKLPVRHVTIGPKNNIDIAKNGVEYYLRSRGYPLEHITVSKSVVSLRY